MIPRTFSRVINRSAALQLPRVGSPGFSVSAGSLHLSALLVLALLALTFDAGAAGVTGTALKDAYDALNAMVNGYGKQLLTVIGFAVAAIGFIASNATSVIMKFVGYAIFLGVGLAGATSLVGAVV
jgi:hypothetical protein